MVERYEKNCKSCFYSEFYHNDEELDFEEGTCHRFPPIIRNPVKLHADDFNGSFPDIQEEDWCGEWHPNIPP